MKLINIGTSMINERFVSAFIESEVGEYLGCYSRSVSSGQSFMDKHNFEGVVYTDLNEMLNSEVDVVYIGSPNGIHYQQAVLALKAKKNVICEKPLVGSLKEFDELFDLAEKNDVFLFEAITIVHLPNTKVIKKHLGEIEPIKLCHIDLNQYSSRYDLLLKGETPNIFSKELEGGALNDLGVYSYHLAYNLFGKPSEQTAFFNYQNGIDVSGVGLLRYPNLVCHLTFAKDCSSRMLSTISGEKGYIEIEGSIGRIPSVYLIKNGERKLISVENRSNHLIYEVENFARIIKENDRNEYLRLRDISRAVLELMVEARD